jgi:hypothetical protein
MLIENTKPIIVPATQEIVFDAFWASRIIIDMPSPESSGKALVELKPYNKSLKKTTDKKEVLIVDDIWGKAENNAEIANAIVSMINAINALKKQADAENK